MMNRRQAVKTAALASFGCVTWSPPALNAQPAQTTSPPAELSDYSQPGDYMRNLMMGEEKRSYLIHIPKNHDAKKPVPVVLALHGAAMNGPLMAGFCGLSETADKAAFVVVYPNGNGVFPLLFWNAGGLRRPMAQGMPDDVDFIRKLIDDLGSVVKVDSKRVYACGMSNGGMMCYRLAAELSDRIAAIAPVAGTIAIEESNPKRPVSVIHFHGTKDKIVPFGKAGGKTRFFVKDVEASVQTWVKLNGCDEKPKTDILTKESDEMKVTRQTYGGGKDGTEVVLIAIEGGGHTWPGMIPMVSFIGKSTLSISANDLIWEFFQKHPLK
jgi:polyhydroxybutyrate depolymerase